MNRPALNAVARSARRNGPKRRLLSRAAAGLLAAAAGAPFLPGRLSGEQGAGEPRVLYLGDSLSLGTFGETLDARLRERSARVFTYVTGSGSPYFWLGKHRPVTASIGYWEKTETRERREEFVTAPPQLETLLRLHRPDVVVVQAGTRLYDALRSPAADRRERVRAVVDAFCRAMDEADAGIFWIEPPQAHPKRVPPALQRDLGEWIREAVARHGGAVFSSADLLAWTLPYPELSDGIHYGRVESRQWAEAAADTFEAWWGGAGGTAGRPAGGSAAEAPGSSGAIRARRIEPPEVLEGVGDLQVKLVLRRKSGVAGEDAAREGGTVWGLFEYEVAQVYRGSYPHPRLRVAHLLVGAGRETAPNRFTVGGEYYLTLARMDRIPALEGVVLASQLPPDESLPVYICRF